MERLPTDVHFYVTGANGDLPDNEIIRHLSPSVEQHVAEMLFGKTADQAIIRSVANMILRGMIAQCRSEIEGFDNAFREADEALKRAGLMAA